MIPADTAARQGLTTDTPLYVVPPPAPTLLDCTRSRHISSRSEM